MPELTNYDLWQIERYGDYLPPSLPAHHGETDAKEEQLQREADYVQQQAELQLFEMQY